MCCKCCTGLASGVEAARVSLSTLSLIHLPRALCCKSLFPTPCIYHCCLDSLTHLPTDQTFLCLTMWMESPLQGSKTSWKQNLSSRSQRMTPEPVVLSKRCLQAIPITHQARSTCPFACLPVILFLANEIRPNFRSVPQLGGSVPAEPQLVRATARQSHSSSDCTQAGVLLLLLLHGLQPVA